MKGKLITLEGIDGSGKSTITERLKNHPSLSDVVFTREPTKNWIGNVVEQAIQSDTDQIAEFFLFTSDHAEHIAKLIKPNLENGQNIISDRYLDSRCAYQGATLSNRFENSIQWVKSIHKGWTIIPDLTIFLDIDPEFAIERCGNRGQQTKFEKMEFLQQVYDNYQKLIKEEPVRFVVVDSNQPVEEVEKDVVDIITSYI
ncbi:MAG: dTMP kinase [Methanohalobium sp.]|uniref:dTMP kinase n=1 Tax=Methanohalobium sp. TaxID=2837493 RepID=UPI00397D6480